MSSSIRQPLSGTSNAAGNVRVAEDGERRVRSIGYGPSLHWCAIRRLGASKLDDVNALRRAAFAPVLGSFTAVENVRFPSTWLLGCVTRRKRPRPGTAKRGMTGKLERTSTTQPSTAPPNTQHHEQIRHTLVTSSAIHRKIEAEDELQKSSNKGTLHANPRVARHACHTAHSS